MDICEIIEIISMNYVALMNLTTINELVHEIHWKNVKIQPLKRLPNPFE